MTADVKNGNAEAAAYVMNRVGAQGETKEMSKQGHGQVPDVKGMGARDAVYQMESRGIKVRLIGRGTVKEQSLIAGSDVKPGMICELRLTTTATTKNRQKEKEIEI
jgi:cell division protein FtsI (penicillin-binding protein 3)